MDGEFPPVSAFLPLGHKEKAANRRIGPQKGAE